MIFSKEANQTEYPFTLPNLPYATSDLEPHMSAETFEYHHKKHHNTYVTNLNKLLENNADFASKSLEDIILASAKDDKLAGIFNNAAQVWNHSFFWHSMKKGGGGKPSGSLLSLIEKSFDSYENFADLFKNAGISQFGSGWVWLVFESDSLKIVKTSNAATPITNNQLPLLCCDVWEHAYYIDHRNNRAGFLSVFLDNLANWDFAEKNLVF
ncbi:MAG: superoxide dismutase [Rickettsiaceae bacterium]|nr:superoxide dismutase [Rickettsiaceae bacterium]